MTPHARTSLGRILMLDAATCAAMGLLLLAAARPLSALMAIPGPILFWAGAILIPVALFMALVGRAGTGSAAAVWLVILGNIGWVIASAGLFAFVSPNTLGTLFVVAQAAVVAALARLEFAAWRRMSAGHMAV